MSAIDEGIVREYFEQNGFLVRQASKYQVQARRKMTSDEEVDLLVYNPGYQRGARKPDFFLFSTELPSIHRAIVVVKGWHTTGHFTPATLKSSPEIFTFLAENVVKEATRFFPVDPDEPGNHPDITKILVLPGLPTAEPFRSQSVQMLKERGRRCHHFLPHDAARHHRQDRNQPELPQIRHAAAAPHPQDLRFSEGTAARPAARAAPPDAGAKGASQASSGDRRPSSRGVRAIDA